MGPEGGGSTRGTQKRTLGALRSLLKADQAAGGQGLSQDELAHRLGFHPATISRALRRLSLAGDVRTHRAHVRGRTYRVLVYELTPTGLQREDYALEVSSFQALPSPEEVFVGRTRELASLRRGFERGGLVVVDGVPGVGKTSLVRRAVRLAPTSHAIVWSSLRSTSSPGSLEDELRRVARASGGHVGTPPVEGGTSEIMPTEGTSARNVVDLIGRSRKPVLWVFDDVQTVPPSTQGAILEILGAFPSGSRHTAVLISQRELPWPLPQGGAAAHVSLRGLKRHEAIALTGALGLPEGRFERVYEETLGNPRYLRLSCRNGLPEGAAFADAVLTSLPLHQRRALLPLALAWSALPMQSGLFAGLSPDEVEMLVTQAVLDRSEGGFVLPEPLARRLVETAHPEEAVQAHAFLAASASVPPAERFVHAVGSDQARAAHRLVLRQRNAILAGADDRVRRAALRLANSLPRGRRRGDLWLLLAEIERNRGDFVAASTFLERAMEQLPSDDPSAIHAAAVLSITSLRAGHAEQAAQWARSVAGLRREHRWAAAGALAQGNVLTYRHDLEMGGRFLESAEQLARRHRQPEIRLMALHGLAYLRAERGDLEGSARAVREGIRLARSLGRRDFLRILRACECRLLAARGELGLAYQGYQEIVRDSREAGALPHLASGLLGMSFVLRLKGDSGKATTFAREAVTAAEGAQDRSIIAHAYGALADLLRRENKLHEARQLAKRARALASEIGPSPSSNQVDESWELLQSLPVRPTAGHVRAAGGRLLTPPARRNAMARTSAETRLDRWRSPRTVDPELTEGT